MQVACSRAITQSDVWAINALSGIIISGQAGSADSMKFVAAPSHLQELASNTKLVVKKEVRGVG